MDDAIGALAGSVIGIVLLIALGGVILAGWLIYKFCELVLPPLFEWLGEVCDTASRRLDAWWRKVTFERRVRRATKDAARQIRETHSEHVAAIDELAVAYERKLPLTAGETAGVRSAVSAAVR